MSSLINLEVENKTYDELYNRPFRYRVEIWNPRETRQLYVSDGFDIAQSNLVVTNIGINQAQWETWEAAITVDDSIYHNISQEILDNGTVMKIMLGKTKTGAENAFYGIIDKVGPTRSGYSKLVYNINAKGFGVIPNYSYINFQKVPPAQTLETGSQLVTNTAAIPFFANNLVKSIWNDLDIIPLIDYTMTQRMGPNFEIDAVIDTVKDFIPGIKNPLVTASQVINLIARMSGAIWYVDQNKKFQFRYPFGDNSGHLIKDYPSSDDSGDYVSYVKEGTSIAYQDSTAPEDGFANQLFAIADKTDVVGIHTRAISFTSTYKKDIAFAVKMDVSKLRNMTFIMSKVGAGTDAPNPKLTKVHCAIVADNNFTPTGKVLDYFNINLSDITETPQPIVKLDRPDIPDIYIDKLIWVVIMELGSAENNTVRVWHDDNRNTASTPDNPRYAATKLYKIGRSSYVFDPKGWYVNARGPAYSIAFATTTSIIVEASDDASIEKWTPGRPVQSRATIPTLKSVPATKAYLDMLVQQTAQKIRNYNQVETTIPNILITPGTEVQIVSNIIPDLAFENNRVATIKNISYSLDVKNFAIGSKYCTVGLKGYVSPY